MASVDTAVFDAEVVRALRLLGAGPEEPAVDALVDPRGAAEAIASLAPGTDNALILRAAQELGHAAKGYAPRPADPVWIRLRSGSAELSIAPLRLKTDQGEPEKGLARRVTVVSDARPCCDAPSCKLERTRAAAWIEMDLTSKGAGESSRRLLLAEAWDLEPQKAVERAAGVAAVLARSLAVPLVVGGAEMSPAEIDSSASGFLDRDPGEPRLPRLTAAALARFALRSEGDRIVIRDHASPGPRLSARRTLLIGALLLVAGAVLWIQTVRSLSGEGLGAPIAFGAVAALLTITAYAFLGVGRFASRYAAESAPILAFGLDQMIVAPWVSRDGAVDLRPEGRLGAAIPIFEVRAVSTKLDAGRSIIELDTDHGSINGLACDNGEVAEVFCEAIRSSLDGARHPKVGASARQRARGLRL